MKCVFYFFDCTVHLKGWLHSVSGRCFNLAFLTLPEPPYIRQWFFVSKMPSSRLPEVFLSHSYPWFWRGPTWPWCLQHTLVTVGGFWLSWYLLRPATGPTSLIMKETLPSQAGWFLQTPGVLVHFVSRSWCCVLCFVWRPIERYPSHRPSMLHLQLYRCWCKHKAHLYVNTLCMDFLPEYFCTITVTFVVFKGSLSFPENMNCSANINLFHKFNMIFLV